MMAKLREVAEHLGLWTPTPSDAALDAREREIAEYERIVTRAALRARIAVEGRHSFMPEDRAPC